MQIRLKTALKGMVVLACIFYASRRMYYDGFSPIMVPIAIVLLFATFLPELIDVLLNRPDR